MFNFQKEDLLVNLKIYYISFVFNLFGSLYQLFWPASPVGNLGVINDSSPFAILQPIYLFFLLCYIVFTTTIGLTLYSQKVKYNYFLQFLKLILVSSPIIFFYLFFNTQLNIFSCLMFSIFQFILVFFLTKTV